MMREFAIEVRPGARVPDMPEPIRIAAGDIVFTQLLRPGANAPEDYVEAPPAQLAFWLVDNWWRLIAECTPSSGPTPAWRLAHDLASMGAFAWPRLAIWGEGDRVGLSSRSDPVGVVGPVRYLTDALTYVSASAFEQAALAFISEVASQRSALASDWVALATQLEALMAERADPDLTEYRRLEAQLGYDVDEAPEGLLDAMAQLVNRYGSSAISEAALARQGDDAARVLKSEIELATRHHWQCDLTRMASKVGPVMRSPNDAPWELGERAAANVRKIAGYPQGPLTNGALGDILSVRSTAFRSQAPAKAEQRAYGVRLIEGRKRGEVVNLAASWSADRRFEFARALGDAIWTEGEALGLITRAKSERQKFQRAFAQSLLCPYEDLIAYIGDEVTDGALAAAARHFKVSERVVRTLLVNKRDLARTRLDYAVRPQTPLADTSVTFEEAVEAA